MGKNNEKNNDSNIKKYDLIGQGSYGCVYYPAIRCSKVLEYINKKNQNSKNSISKVFNRNKSFEEEIKFLKSINSIDKYGKYFVVPNKTCLTNVNTILKHTNGKCHIFDYMNTQQQLYQIVLPNSGKPLQKFMEDYKDTNKIKYPIKEWIKNIENILYGIELLNENSLIHRDIKSDNILFDGKKAKIIDLGLMCPKEDIYKINNKHILEYNYLPYPFEFLLVYFNMYATNFQKQTVNLVSIFEQSISSFGNEAEELFNILHSPINIKKSIEDIEKWKNSNTNWFSEIKKNTDKIDIYSFGTVCISLSNLLDNSTITQEEHIRYQNFLYKITKIDFRERYNIKQAIELYKTILS